jgi:hypothetical protein
VTQAVVIQPNIAVPGDQPVLEKHRFEPAVVVKVLDMTKIRDTDGHVSVEVRCTVPGDF